MFWNNKALSLGQSIYSQTPFQIISCSFSSLSGQQNEVYCEKRRIPIYNFQKNTEFYSQFLKRVLIAPPVIVTDLTPSLYVTSTPVPPPEITIETPTEYTLLPSASTKEGKGLPKGVLIAIVVIVCIVVLFAIIAVVLIIIKKKSSIKIYPADQWKPRGDPLPLVIVPTLYSKYGYGYEDNGISEDESADDA